MYGLATTVCAVSHLPFWQISCERATNLWKVKDPTSISQKLSSHFHNQLHGKTVLTLLLYNHGDHMMRK